MIEAGQDLTLGPKPGHERLAQSRTHQLDRRRLIERPLALGAPHLAHPAAPDALHQAPRAGLRRRGLEVGTGRAVQELVLEVGCEQALDLLAQRPVGVAVRPDRLEVEECGAVGRIEIGGAVEEVRYAGPAVGSHRGRAGVGCGLEVGRNERRGPEVRRLRCVPRGQVKAKRSMRSVPTE